ncbi:Target of rapamycin complex 2 subunit avo2, partial [Elasticomyces elasticus]
MTETTTYDTTFTIRRGEEEIWVDRSDQWCPFSVLKHLLMTTSCNPRDTERIFEDRLESNNLTAFEIRVLLTWACKFGKTSIADLLIKQLSSDIEADPAHNYIKRLYSDRSSATRGLAPLLPAAQHGMTSTVAKLLQEGEHPNCFDSKGRTPLMMAAEHGHLAVVKVLLNDSRKTKVDLHVTDAAGRNVMHYATQNRMVDVCIYMIKQASHEEKFEDRHGVTALPLAAVAGLAEVVKALKKKAEDGIIDINAACEDNKMTALHYAVQYTLEAYRVGNKDFCSDSEWHNAAEGHDTIAALLSIPGIDANRCDADGETALEFAASRGNIHVVKTLLKHDKEMK